MAVKSCDGDSLLVASCFALLVCVSPNDIRLSLMFRRDRRGAWRAYHHVIISGVDRIVNLDMVETNEGFGFI